MLQLNDISDNSGGLDLIERQHPAVAAADGGSFLPLLRAHSLHEETTCL